MDENNKMESHTKQNLIKAVKLVLLVCSAFFAGLALVFAMGVDSRLAADEGILRDVSGSLSQVNRKLDSMTQTLEETESAESSSPAEEVPTYTQEELISMAVSDDFNNMMEVALYPEATETQLMLVAQECINAIGSDINKLMPLVVSLVDNPNCTTSVVTALANINYYEVWLVVAQSDLCSEATLLLLAEQCSPYNSNTDANLLVPVVSAICENNAISMHVIQVLNNNYYVCIQDVVWAKKIELLQPEILETPHP